jgi:hypothetical protein
MLNTCSYIPAPTFDFLQNLMVASSITTMSSWQSAVQLPHHFKWTHVNWCTWHYQHWNIHMQTDILMVLPASWFQFHNFTCFSRDKFRKYILHYTLHMCNCICNPWYDFLCTGTILPATLKGLQLLAHKQSSKCYAAICIIGILFSWTKQQHIYILPVWPVPCLSICTLKIFSFWGGGGRYWPRGSIKFDFKKSCHKHN